MGGKYAKQAHKTKRQRKTEEPKVRHVWGKPVRIHKDKSKYDRDEEKRILRREARKARKRIRELCKRILEEEE